MQDTHLIYATESLIKSAPNAHKLKKLTTTMQAIINILQKGDRRERSSSGDDYFAKDDLVKVSELSCDYARLMFWIDEMNPKQKFWNFRSIRSKVKSMEERADAVALMLECASIRGHAQDIQRHMEEAEACMKARDEEDNRDLKKFENAHMKLALALAAVLNRPTDSGSEAMEAFKVLFDMEHIEQLAAAAEPAAVQEIVHAEERDNVKASAERYRKLAEEAGISVQDAVKIAHELSGPVDDEPDYPDVISKVKNA
ncbi:hypothetical protein EWM64_g582 [Hericium alpestre]|uniref:Uncharacterized protein n=1 Tax=Hericium alpestre TaxID=135208 RepID=A0A4Z0AAR4_9AGAM|nr:hypothetical protein EWM64_g582 [Hericium alpestre]